MDIGDCKKLHSDSMKEEFDQSVKDGKDQGLYRDLERYLQKVVDDVDNKIRAAHKRVAEIDSKVLTIFSSCSNEQNDDAISTEIKSLMARAEQLGEEGKVDENHRKTYRKPKREIAVKVYTVNHESKYLLVKNVPALGATKELLQLFSSFGPIVE